MSITHNTLISLPGPGLGGCSMVGVLTRLIGILSLLQQALSGAVDNAAYLVAMLTSITGLCPEKITIASRL